METVSFSVSDEMKVVVIPINSSINVIVEFRINEVEITERRIDINLSP